MTNDTSRKKIIVVLLFVIVILFGIIGYLIYKNVNLSSKNNNNVNNEEKNEKYLSLKDFPFKDDMSEDSNYIKFKGQLSFMSSSKLDKNNKTLISTFENYSFVLESVNTTCFTEEEGAYLEATEYSLKINDVLIFASSRSYPYILLTDKYLIIRNESVQHYDNQVYENNLEKLGNIYIYDSNLRKILEINNINTYNMTKTYSRLNGSLDFAIKNNILYYVTGNNTSRTLKYVDLNESNISEKVIESFDYSDNITRNKNIISINQFPYESSSNNVQTINGYDLVIDYSKNIMNISKSNEKLKEINFISWYINPNGFHSADLLGGSSSIYIYENKMYYLIDNKNNTISLKSINFNNELKEELIETFKFYKFDDSTNDSMIFGDCEPQRY